MARLSYYLEMARQVRPRRILPKILNYAKYRILPKKSTMSARRYTPQIGAILLTRRCNLDCDYCSVEKFRKEKGVSSRETEADIEKIRRIFENPLYANCLLIDLLGGEPLLVKDLDGIVAFLAGRGHMTNIATNGLLLAGRISDLKNAGVSRISVSLYDENRQVLERDLSGVNRVFPVHASLVLLRSEVEKRPEKIVETARFVREAGCLGLRLYSYRPMGVEPKPEEIITETHAGYLDLRRRLEGLYPGFCCWPAAVGVEGGPKLCPQLWQRVTCDVSGVMGICCGTDMTLKGAGSNLLEDDPDVVFNHPLLVKMREQLLDPDVAPPAICRTCNLLGDPGW